MSETTTETVAKPRGKCTGCAFSYQLSRSRSGGFRGQLVIRKHNCRTGPGLCSGALNPPEGAGTRNISQHGEDLTAAYSPQEDPSCEQCERDPDYCSQAPHPEPEPTYGEFGDGQHADGCTEEQRFGPSVCSGCPQPNVVPISQFAGHSVVGFVSSEGAVDVTPVPGPDYPKNSAGHCVQPPAAKHAEECALNRLDSGHICDCRNEESDPVRQLRLAGAFDPEDVVGVAPGGHPIVAPVTVLEYGSAVTAPDPFTAPAAYTDPNASRYEQDDNPGTVTSVQFTAPAPASDIPESATTVSGQPEPDRDRWGRYLIFGNPHTRATTFAKLGANTKAIEAWNERNVIRGMTLRPDLLMLANGLEVKRDRNDLNSIAAQAKDAAGSKVAANIGTAYHAFSERLDAGLISLMDVPEQYRRRVGQYQDAIRRAGLGTRPEWIERATAVRADQVGAPLPVAGTLDRIFQLPDGSLVIGDLKTGSDLSYGEMEIEVQLALYAHGVNTHGLFDWNTKTWENRISSEQPTGVLRVRTDIAIVIHLPADGDGCTLYVADIERGWRDAQRLGPLQASLKEKKRFRTLMAADLAPRPATTHDVIEPPDSQWEHAKHLFSTAPDQARIAELYQYAMDSGLFHVDQLAVLVGLGKDRLNALRGA